MQEYDWHLQGAAQHCIYRLTGTWRLRSARRHATPTAAIWGRGWRAREGERVLRISRKGETAPARGIRGGMALEGTAELALEGRDLCARDQLRLGGGQGTGMNPRHRLKVLRGIYSVNSTGEMQTEHNSTGLVDT